MLTDDVLPWAFATSRGLLEKLISTHQHTDVPADDVLPWAFATSRGVSMIISTRSARFVAASPGSNEHVDGRRGNRSTLNEPTQTLANPGRTTTVASLVESQPTLVGPTLRQKLAGSSCRQGRGSRRSSELCVAGTLNAARVIERDTSIRGLLIQCLFVCLCLRLQVCLRWHCYLRGFVFRSPQAR